LWRIAHKNSETIRIRFDVAQQCKRGVFEDHTRPFLGIKGGFKGAHESVNFAVDDDGVQAFFSAKMLINDGLGNLGLRGNFFDACPVESF
jgi:hypothetical protein